jgi:DNA-binding PadR family transcriptional regulator
MELFVKNQKTQFVILGLLTIEPLSGYDIKKFIDKSISHFWSESNGQLYPALNQLVQKNLIVLEERQQTGKKVSHLYSITDDGRAALKKWLDEAAEKKSTHRDEELLKLFFGKNSSSKTSIDLLRKRASRVQEKLKKYQEIRDEIKKYSHSPHHRFWSLNVNNGIYHAEVELRWCQESIQMLEVEE